MNYMFQHVTLWSIKVTILLLWMTTVVLVCLPFAGFGLYYDEQKQPAKRCVRYRFATKYKDIAYAYLVFGFGEFTFNSFSDIKYFFSLSEMISMTCKSKVNPQIFFEDLNLSHEVIWMFSLYLSSSGTLCVYRGV